mmetsp:Transcript_54603/g.81323  ORF Transcript_54603/g.81323 Transcript_54603/m.81323 type:complete len:133 (+) Transcript_54603:70-468(+)
MKSAILAAALAVIIHSCDAFSTQSRISVKSPGSSTFGNRNARPWHLPMSTKEEGTKAKSERLTEGGECIPEDEYCAVDKKTGAYIRLTLAEKERIFIDSLQASSLFLYSLFHFHSACILAPLLQRKYIPYLI